MNQRVALILALLVIVILIVTAISRSMRFMEIDSCVDSGGIWNEEQEVCERE